MSKVPISIRLDADLVERLRNAVWHLGRGLTVTTVVEQAIRQAVSELERENGGKPYPRRKSELPKSPKRDR